MDMVEFELSQRILSQELRPANQTLLKEIMLDKPHTATVVSNGIGEYVLYRLDCDEKDWLPFFNTVPTSQNHTVPFPTPKYLRSFCDYILLVSRQEKLYVLLVEMKSGDHAHSDAARQLEASAAFMDYIRLTADRICRYNDYNTFDSNCIKMRKVILKPCPKTRPKTNIAKDSSINWDADTVVIPGNTLPLLKLCH